MSKHFINDPNSCVDEFLCGITSIHEGLFQLPGHRVVLRRDLKDLKGKVALLSGGGAGHEPAHAGFVGRGMLAGAISGSVFTSPPPTSIFAAIKAVNKFGPSGIVLILKNYTGDRLNFGLAREWAVAQGIKVEMVVAGEDCALQSADRSAGRRGLAGVLFLHKIGGAMAEKGAKSEEIVVFLRKISKNIGTIGVCMSPCILPGSETTSFKLCKGEMELGLGIHGEAGVKRMEVLSSRETVDVMLSHMLDPNSATNLPVKANENVALLLNNLGGTSNLEMGVIVKDTLEALSKRKLIVSRIFSGTFMTSLQMAGFSLSLLRLSQMDVSEESVLRLLDAPVEVSSPLTSMRCGVNLEIPTFEDLKTDHLPTLRGKGPYLEDSLLKKCLIAGCQVLIEKKDTLNEYDRGAGDGDCGTTHARGANRGLALVKDGGLGSLVETFQKLNEICSEDMGGSSGAIYSILFTSMANKLSTENSLTVPIFAQALKEATQAVKRYGGANRGDRTIIDVLEPLFTHFLEAEGSTSEVLEKAATVSEAAAENTVGMKAQAGRASYVHRSELKYPDAGSFAVAQVVKAVVGVLRGEKF